MEQSYKTDSENREIIMGLTVLIEYKQMTVLLGYLNKHNLLLQDQLVALQDVQHPWRRDGMLENSAPLEDLSSKIALITLTTSLSKQTDQYLDQCLVICED